MKEEAGLDIGATLSKVALVAEGGDPSGFEGHVFPAADLEALASLLLSHGVARIAATGAGASRLAALLGSVEIVGEFEAWGAGERTLLRLASFVPATPHLLVSLGTGTSILRVDDGGAVTRAGGTALGGGTLRGLGALLFGEGDHEHLAALARRGDRRRVDLLVSDIYRPGEIALADDLTAANFGKPESREPSDLAQALTRLVGENVGLLAGALAVSMAPGSSGRPDVVYAGSTLHNHEELREVLAFATALAGAEARFLPRGEFAGAVGALARLRETTREAGAVRR